MNLTLATTLVALSLALSTDGDAITEIRALMRRGLLQQAEERLTATERSGRADERAWAALLRGNIAYERGDLDGAEAAYGVARSLFTEVGAAEGHQVAAGNLELVRERKVRRAELRGRLSRVSVLIAAFLLLAAGSLVLLVRRTSERAWSPEAPRPS